MMRKTPYQKLLERKRKWTPVQTTAGKFRDGSEDTIKRALAIRHMELPVGTFIQEGLEKTVPDHARTLLEDNVKDEIRHDLALQYIVNAHGADENAEKEAKRIEMLGYNILITLLSRLSSQSEPYFLSFFRSFVLVAIVVLVLAAPTLAETNKFMLQLIPLYVVSWIYLLVNLWINLGRPPLTGFFNP